MRSILKALGLTIWGLIAFGLVAIFIFVGYEIALKYRATSGSVDTERAASNQGRLSLPGPSVGNVRKAVRAVRNMRAAPIAVSEGTIALQMADTRGLR